MHTASSKPPAPGVVASPVMPRSGHERIPTGARIARLVVLVLGPASRVKR